MTSWSPVSHPGLASMALFSADSNHRLHTSRTLAFWQCATEYFSVLLFRPYRICIAYATVLQSTDSVCLVVAMRSVKTVNRLRCGREHKNNVLRAGIPQGKEQCSGHLPGPSRTTVKYRKYPVRASVIRQLAAITDATLRCQSQLLQQLRLTVLFFTIPQCWLYKLQLHYLLTGIYINYFTNYQ